MFLCLICIRIFGLEGVIRLNQYADDAFIDEHLLYNLILRQCHPPVIWVNDMESPFPINFFQNNEVSRIKIKNGRKRHPTDVIERDAYRDTPQSNFCTYSGYIADCTTNPR